MTVEVQYPTPDNYIPTTFQQRLAIREAEAGILPVDQLTTEEAREEQYRRLESMIGNTPLLYVDGPNNSVIIVKDESQNPTESHYDRVYIKTLKKLEEDRIIKPGDELWEVTSGSAGISFAWLCSRLGYKARVYVPARLPEARKQEIRNFGVRVEEISKVVKVVDEVTGEEKEEDVVYVPEASEKLWNDFVTLRSKGYRKFSKADTEDYSTRSAELDEQTRVVLVNHSWNHLSHKALEAIGEEVSAVIPRGVNVNYFVTVIGNGSSTRGVSDALRRRFSGYRKLIPDLNKRFRKRIKIVGVETDANPVWFVQKYPGRFQRMFHREPTFEAQEMYGGSALGADLIKFVDVSKIDQIRLITKEQYKEMMEEYNKGKQPGEMIGRSSAGSLIVAQQLAKEHPNSLILMMFYDKGDRYGYPAIGEQDFVTVPPQDWRQWVAKSPVDLPRSLRQTYKPKEQIVRENIIADLEKLT